MSLFAEYSTAKNMFHNKAVPQPHTVFRTELNDNVQYSTVQTTDLAKSKRNMKITDGSPIQSRVLHHKLHTVAMVKHSDGIKD